VKGWPRWTKILSPSSKCSVTIALETGTFVYMYPLERPNDKNQNPPRWDRRSMMRSSLISGRHETRRDETWFVPWWGTVGKKRRGCQPFISWRGKQGCKDAKEIIVNDDGKTTCPFRLGHALTSWKKIIKTCLVVVVMESVSAMGCLHHTV
jgi:hypothetical protein